MQLYFVFRGIYDDSLYNHEFRMKVNFSKSVLLYSTVTRRLCSCLQGIQVLVFLDWQHVLCSCNKIPSGWICTLFHGDTLQLSLCCCRRLLSFCLLKPINLISGTKQDFIPLPDLAHAHFSSRFAQRNTHTGKFMMMYLSSKP